MKERRLMIYPVIILLIGLGTLVGLIALKTPPAIKNSTDYAPVVRVTPIDVSPRQIVVESSGQVYARYETDITAQVDGKIVEISDLFLKGGYVDKGTLLARIDPSDYEVALVDANASLAENQANLIEELAKAKVAEAEWREVTRSTPTELALRKPQLARTLAHVRAAEAAVMFAERRLQRTEIRSPYDAIIKSRHVSLGSVIFAGEDLGTVQNRNIAEVRLPVSDRDLKFLPNLGVDSVVILSSDFLGEEHSWTARITREEGVVDERTRMTFLVAEIDNPYEHQTKDTKLHGDAPLRFGTFVTARISGMQIDNAAAIPQHLVVNNKVAILRDDNTLELRPVLVLRNDGKNAIINGELKPNEKLITSTLEFPVDGMALTLSNLAGPSSETLTENTKSTTGNADLVGHKG